jgi:hypothetical protein
MSKVIERRIYMPNGRRDSDSKYDPLWCKAEHDRINKKLDEICGPDGYLTRVHKRIDNLWYLIAGVGVIGLANLIVTVIRTGV